MRAVASTGADIEAVSSIYETAPRELDDQPSFLNGALRARSALAPPALLAEVKRIERELGRDPGGVRFGPRVIDCDLLLWEGGTWDEPALQIPHPRLVERRFALVPLLEIDPDLTLPGGARLADVEAALDADEQSVRRVDHPGWPPPARWAYNRGPLAHDQDAT